MEDEELPEREFAASEIQTWDDTSAPQRETPQEHTPPHETNKYESVRLCTLDNSFYILI